MLEIAPGNRSVTLEAALSEAGDNRTAEGVSDIVSIAFD